MPNGEFFEIFGANIHACQFQESTLEVGPYVAVNSQLPILMDSGERFPNDIAVLSQPRCRA